MEAQSKLGTAAEPQLLASAGPGQSTRRRRGSGDASPFAVEKEHVTGGERTHVSGLPVAGKELDLQAIWGKQFNNGSHVAGMDRRIV